MRMSMKDMLSNVIGVSRRKGMLQVTAADTVEPHERHIQCSSSGAGAYAIAFPAPSEVPGAFFFVDFTLKDTDNVTLTAVDRGSDVTLDATAEHVLIYSTGFEYVVVYAIGPSIS